MLGGGVSHPSQLTTGLVIKSVTTSPTLAGERMLFILQVSILSEQMRFARRLQGPKRERESQTTPAWKHEREKRTMDGDAEQGSGEERYHGTYKRRRRWMNAEKPHQPWPVAT